jgi:hypothetical protein
MSASVRWVRERSSNRRRRADACNHLDGGIFCSPNTDDESGCLFHTEFNLSPQIAEPPCNSYIFRETVQNAALFLPPLSIVRPVRRLQMILRTAIRLVRSISCNAAIS